MSSLSLLPIFNSNQDFVPLLLTCYFLIHWFVRETPESISFQLYFLINLYHQKLWILCYITTMLSSQVTKSGITFTEILEIKTIVKIILYLHGSFLVHTICILFYFTLCRAWSGYHSGSRELAWKGERGVCAHSTERKEKQMGPEQELKRGQKYQ